MFGGLSELCSKAMNFDSKGMNGKSDPSTLGIVFVAFLCALLPLEISQLSFAIVLAFLYAMLTKRDQSAPKKQAHFAAPYNATPRALKTKAWPASKVKMSANVTKPTLPPPANPEVRARSAQPIVAPTFHSDGWEGEIQELLLQITPTAEAQEVVNQLALMIKKTMRSMLPEIEVQGFANGSLTSGKAFGAAVPEVEIVATISPQALLGHRGAGGHKDSSSVWRDFQSQCNEAQVEVEVRKLQKTTIRACADRLVSAGGLKFRRSAFTGRDPKVTFVAPASLGFFAEAIPIDFSVNVVTPIYNAALLKECGNMDSRAKELILIVKRWAKDRGICHAAKGHLSPYMWGLLTMYFLQVGVSDEGPLLPPLEQFGLPSEIHKGKRSSAKWESAQTAEPKKSAAALFKEFVHFFHTQFDWSNEAVSIRAAQRAPPTAELPLHSIVSDDPAASQVGPSIEDPFNKEQNLGDGMNSASLARLKEELARAEDLCVREASLSELLEPWAPKANENGEQLHESLAAPAEKSAPKKLAKVPSSKEDDWRRGAMQAPRPWRRAQVAA